MSDSPASDESGLRQVLAELAETGAGAEEEEEEVEEADPDTAPAPQPEVPAPLTQRGPRTRRAPTKGATEQAWAQVDEAWWLNKDQVISIDDLEWDVNANLGQVRPLDPKLLQTRREGFRTQPPTGLLQVIVVQQPDLSMLSAYLCPSQLQSCLFFRLFITLNPCVV